MQKAFEPGAGKPLAFEELVEVEDVLDAAAEWQAGRLPTTEALKIGGIHTPAFTRFKAITKTPKEDPRWHALYAFCEHLDRLQGAVYTSHGRFNKFDYQQAIRDTDELLDNGIIWTGIR